MEKVLQEVKAQGIPGLTLHDATDADVEHLRGLTALQYLDLMGTKVTDAGLVYLKGLTELQYLDLWATQVTEAGVEQLEKSLPNVKVTR